MKRIGCGRALDDLEFCRTKNSMTGPIVCKLREGGGVNRRFLKLNFKV